MSYMCVYIYILFYTSWARFVCKHLQPQAQTLLGHHRLSPPGSQDILIYPTSAKAQVSQYKSN
jgi:hypothetical protein